MSDMKDFCFWFFTQLPDFLMSEPVFYFVGVAFLLVVIGLFKSIININQNPPTKSVNTDFVGGLFSKTGYPSKGIIKIFVIPENQISSSIISPPCAPFMKC